MNERLNEYNNEELFGSGFLDEGQIKDGKKAGR